MLHTHLRHLICSILYNFACPHQGGHDPIAELLRRAIALEAPEVRLIPEHGLVQSLDCLPFRHALAPLQEPSTKGSTAPVGAETLGARHAPEVLVVGMFNLPPVEKVAIHAFCMHFRYKERVQSNNSEEWLVSFA